MKTATSSAKPPLADWGLRDCRWPIPASRRPDDPPPRVRRHSRSRRHCSDTRIHARLPSASMGAARGFKEASHGLPRQALRPRLSSRINVPPRAEIASLTFDPTCHTLARSSSVCPERSPEGPVAMPDGSVICCQTVYRAPVYYAYERASVRPIFPCPTHAPALATKRCWRRVRYRRWPGWPKRPHESSCDTPME